MSQEHSAQSEAGGGEAGSPAGGGWRGSTTLLTQDFGLLASRTVR